MCLCLLCRRGRGRAARRDRRPQELLGHANTRLSFLLHLSACPVSPTVVKHFFHKALALNALPVHLLRQVYFFVFLSFLFRVCFLFVWWKVLEGSFGARRVLFGSILETFGCHFGDFWEVRWMFENVCFTKVKHYFWRFGRVLIHDFFMLFFLSVFHEHSLLTFLDVVGSQGSHRDPNGSHLGTLRGQIWV